ncbi:unnamed protein product, partial [Ectocarpus sp. 8 AP-2014]
MAAMRGGRGGIEDELVGAAMQISTLGKENKRVKRELASAVSENARLMKVSAWVLAGKTEGLREVWAGGQLSVVSR